MEWNEIMSVLGLKSVYTVKYGLSPWDFSQAVPSGNPSGSGHILPYIPPLLMVSRNPSSVMTIQ